MEKRSTLCGEKKMRLEERKEMSACRVQKLIDWLFPGEKKKEEDVSIQDEKDGKVRFLFIQGLAGLLNANPC